MCTSLLFTPIGDFPPGEIHLSSLANHSLVWLCSRMDGYPGAVAGVSHEITNVASSTATISYSYKVSGSTEGRGTCSLVITVGQDTVDTFSAANNNSGWITRTASFVPSASSGTLNFSWDCSNFREDLGDFEELDILLDNISGDFDFACP